MASKTIYVFKQGSVTKADLILPFGAALLASYRIDSQNDASRLKANPGPYLPERIIALIERFLDELPKTSDGFAASFSGGFGRKNGQRKIGG